MNDMRQFTATPTVEELEAEIEQLQHHIEEHQSLYALQKMEIERLQNERDWWKDRVVNGSDTLNDRGSNQYANPEVEFDLLDPTTHHLAYEENDDD